MTTILIEHAQYVDDAGKPIAGGKLYVGTNGADPVATAGVTTIYSDRALTVPIANPQDLGTDGRALSKIWVDGTYSIQVNSLVGLVETQEFQDLDAGTDTAAVGTLEVIDIVGNNAITGSTSASISSYTANQQFAFTTTAANTGPVTLSIDTAGAKDVVKNKDQPILVAEFQASQVVIVAYNAINDNFEWVNQNNKVIDFSKGFNVASAATTDIWSTVGNSLHVTGTVTISSFGTAPSTGSRRTLFFNDAVTLVNSPNLALPAAANYTTSAGDIVQVYADSSTQFDVVINRKDGRSVTDDGYGANGQAWVDKIGSRSAGTSYQNTTGRTIGVNIWGFNTGSSVAIQVSINNSTWVAVGQISPNDGSGVSSFAVPPGHYYRIAAAISLLSGWSELTT